MKDLLTQFPRKMTQKFRQMTIFTREMTQKFRQMTIFLRVFLQPSSSLIEAKKK
ncbi:hypothetical protein [Pseudooceanicola nanhaiensis]|uniref:hypothetical protein n=1 Tax=Pseudooceanicola nanhaiensis TaxID=375761 RepID=UPI004058B2F0